MSRNLERIAFEHDSTSRGAITVAQVDDLIVMTCEATAGPFDGDAFAMTFTLDGWENFLRELLTFEVELP